MSDTFDKSSKLAIGHEDLVQAQYKKTASNKIAVRVGNEDDTPLHVKSKELILGVDYDEVDDTTLGLVQTIVYKLDNVTVQTVTFTYTNSCKDQYNMVVT